MIVQIVDKPLVEIEGEVLVAYLYTTDRPPHGTTGTVDWYMNGFVSRLIKAGKIKGGRDELVLLATQGRLAVPRVLLLGMGRADEVRPVDFYAAWERLGDTLAGFAVDELVTSIPYMECWGWEVSATLEGMLRGLMDGMRRFRRNLRDFKLVFVDFDRLNTKHNKDTARSFIRSFEGLSVIGF